MVEENMEEDVIDIDILDPVDHSDVIVIPDETERGYTGAGISVSDPKILKTGNIISQFFNLIAQIRSKEYWQLDEIEINSLNKTCPKILPNVIAKNSGLIGCILSLFGIIIKRLKMEQQDQPMKPDEPQEPEIEAQKKSLTGGRSG